jgi:hypothetical protein
MTEQRYGTYLAILAALYLVLALAYGVVNPAFESPDELLHVDYVEELLRSHRLPVAQTEESEYHQPPLYYAAAALLTVWIPPQPDTQAAIQRNIFWPWRIRDVGVDNKSQFLHGPEQDFPWHGLWLRLHLLRAFSSLLGLVVILATAQIGLLIWPGRRDVALMAAGFVAFLPQFLYLSSSVTNDIPTVTCSAVALVLMGRIVRQREHRLRRTVALGVILGGAILTKMSMLILAGLVAILPALYAALRWWQARKVGQPGARAARVPAAEYGSPHLLAVRDFWSPALALLIAAAMAGPYLSRNWVVYGDPTAMSRMDAIWGRNTAQWTPNGALASMLNIWKSFWAQFGYGQIPVPGWSYLLCAILVLLAGLSLSFVLARRLRRRAWDTEQALLLGLVALLIAVFSAATLRYSQTSRAGDFGRFVFPALPVIAVCLGDGWAHLGASIRRARPVLLAGITGAMCAFSIWALVAILRPAYVLPVAPATAGLSDANLRLDDVALVHVSLLTQVLEPGGDALVQVDWLPLRTSSDPLILVLRLLGPDDLVLGSRLSYPGLGRTSTTFWQPGTPFRDVYAVPVEADQAALAAPARVSVGAWFYDRVTDKILPVYDPATEQAIPPVLATQAKLPPARQQPATPATESLARIGDSLQLDAVDYPATVSAGCTVAVTLDWMVLQPLPGSYKLFLHVVPPGATQQLVQLDEPVLGDRYPGSLWAAGEAFSELHRLPIPPDFPPGKYDLRIGMYRSEDWSQRLPVKTASGATQDSYVIGQIVIDDPGAGGGSDCR